MLDFLVIYKYLFNYLYVSQFHCLYLRLYVWECLYASMFIFIEDNESKYTISFSLQRRANTRTRTRTYIDTRIFKHTQMHIIKFTAVGSLVLLLHFTLISFKTSNNNLSFA